MLLLDFPAGDGSGPVSEPLLEEPVHSDGRYSHSVYGADGTVLESFSYITESYADQLIRAGLTITELGQQTDAPATVFADVAADAYYAAPVSWAVEQGITNGTSDTTFSPDRTCSRAQIITFLWRAAGASVPETSSAFSDVPEDAYYADAAAWAAEMGMVEGDAFSPDDPCTRMMAVEFMWKYAGSPDAPEAAFSDVAADAVNWAVETGVTNGTSDDTFSPDGICTRGQIVTFLYRAFAA